MAIQVSREEILTQIANPLMREVFKTSPQQSINAKNLNAILKDPPINRVEFVIGVMRGLNQEQKERSHHVSEKELNQMGNFSKEEVRLASKIDCIQTLIDANQAVNEKLIHQKIAAAKEFNVDRLQTAVEDVQTKAHPQPLIDRIKGNIDKFHEMQLMLVSLHDYVVLENQFAIEKNRSQPFSKGIVFELQNALTEISVTANKVELLETTLMHFEKSIEANTRARSASIEREKKGAEHLLKSPLQENKETIQEIQSPARLRR